MAIMVLTPLMMFAQNNTFSPYSRYGLGDIYRKPLGPYRAMGGTSIGSRIPNAINFMNPAAYTSQDTLSFIFDFGLRYSNETYKSSESSSQLVNSNIDHLAISFPVTSWWYSSAGIFPYSNVGYDILEQNSVGGTLINHYYKGNGGLNEFYIGTAFVPIKNLSMGFNFSYLFGNIEHIRSISSPDYTFLITEETSTTHIKDIFFTGGIQYTLALNKNKYTIGASFDNKAKMNTITDYSLIRYAEGFVVDIDGNDSIDTYAFDTAIIIPDQKGSFNLPSNIGVGFSFNYDDKLIFGFDYSTQNWSEFELLGNSQNYQDNHYLSCGINYTPNPKSLENYFKRVDYRLGGHYYYTNLKLNNTAIMDYGISLGLGIPLKNRKTKVNLTYEYGVKGTTDSYLIQQNYNVISLSMSLYDRWFIKRKFD